MRQALSAWDFILENTTRQKLDVIQGSIGPHVKGEVDCLSRGDQQLPDRVLSHIKSVFGENLSPKQILQKLFAHRQLQGEDVRAYSHRVNASFQTLVAREEALREHPHKEKLLRDHFLSTLLGPSTVQVPWPKCPPDVNTDLQPGQNVRHRVGRRVRGFLLCTGGCNRCCNSSLPPVASPTSPELKDTVQMMHEMMSMMKDMMTSMQHGFE